MPTALEYTTVLETKGTLAVFIEFTVLSVLYIILMKALMWTSAIAHIRKQKVSNNKDLKK